MIFTGDLRGRCFDRQDLRGGQFVEADLYRATFRGADLAAAVFVQCFAAEAVFAGANCTDLVSRSSNFYRAGFRGADLANALFWKCVLAGADLRGAAIRGVTLTLDCNTFEETKLDRATSAELAYLFGRASTPHRQGWLDVVGDGDLSRLERVFAL
jgi:uncharacterized protein YjbI with pentapeptide repeats